MKPLRAWETIRSDGYHIETRRAKSRKYPSAYFSVLPFQCQMNEVHNIVNNVKKDFLFWIEEEMIDLIK